MAQKISLFIAVLFLFSCAQILRDPIKYDQQNYDKMYSAAINQGSRLSYTIDQQDKEYGLVKMSRKVRYSTYSIKVKFGPDSFTVEGEVDSDLFNLTIDKDAKMIEDAIKQAVR